MRAHDVSHSPGALLASWRRGGGPRATTPSFPSHVSSAGRSLFLYLRMTLLLIVLELDREI